MSKATILCNRPTLLLRALPSNRQRLGHRRCRNSRLDGSGGDAAGVKGWRVVVCQFSSGARKDSGSRNGRSADEIRVLNSAFSLARCQGEAGA